MKPVAAAVLVLVSGWSAGAQDAKKTDADKIAAMKAPATAAKLGAEAQKKKGAAISVKSEIAGAPQAVSAAFDGVFRKDFAAGKGTQEVYTKGAQVLVKSGDRFAAPSDLTDAQQAVEATAFKNPALILAEIAQLAATATYGADDKVGDVECRLLLLNAQPLLKQHLKEFGDRLGHIARQFAQGLISGNLSSLLDEKASSSDYQVWVGKGELLVRKIVWTLKPKVKAQSLPPGAPKLDGMEVRTEVTFTKWDEDVPFDIAGVIKQKWGLK